MVAKTWAALGAVTASLALAGVAHADIDSFNPDAFDLSSAIDKDVAPVHRAFELAVGGNYTEGGGDTGGGLARIGDLSGAGGGLQLEASARLSPHWAVGAYGTGAYFSSGSMDSGATVYGASAGLQISAHARPDHSVDPWASVGAGWRGLWLDDAGAHTSLQGIELARVQVGIDYRISSRFAIAPVIGASAAMFLGEDSPMTDSLVGIGAKTVHFYGWTGIQGRFDAGI